MPKAIINFLTLMRSKNSSNRTGKKVTMVIRETFAKLGNFDVNQQVNQRQHR